MKVCVCLCQSALDSRSDDAHRLPPQHLISDLTTFPPQQLPLLSSPSPSSVPPVLIIMPLEARVKSVLSGDTVVLSHISNPSQERVLSLAYVSAPRLRREGDEVGHFSLCCSGYN